MNERTQTAVEDAQLDRKSKQKEEIAPEERESAAKYKEAAARLDRRLFWVVSILLAIVTALFVFGLIVQWRNYRTGIDAALNARVVDHAAVLSYARGLDADFVKTSALFLGFLLVFTGTLYVLRSAASAYQLSVKGEKYGGNLGTSSPGLVIITLGVVLIAVTILTRSELKYDTPTQGQAAETGGKAVEPPPTLGMTNPPPVENSSERKK